MAFCVNCGTKLVAGDKFCGNCGKVIESGPVGTGGASEGAGSGSASETSNKRNVARCPVCGEYLDKYATVCSACGFTVRDVADGSIAVLAAKLEAIERTRPKSLFNVADQALQTTDKKKADLIRNFPIPNTYDDLAEFMAMARANSVASSTSTQVNRMSGEEIVAAAWSAKFDQAYAKAERLYGNRAEFQQFRALKAEKNQGRGHSVLMKWAPFLVWIGLMMIMSLSLSLCHGGRLGYTGL
jgi:hypothetical protein